VCWNERSFIYFMCSNRNPINIYVRRRLGCHPAIITDHHGPRIFRVLFRITNINLSELFYRPLPGYTHVSPSFVSIDFVFSTQHAKYRIEKRARPDKIPPAPTRERRRSRASILCAPHIVQHACLALRASTQRSPTPTPILLPAAVIPPQW
jgi:hypothetical protein